MTDFKNNQFEETVTDTKKKSVGVVPQDSELRKKFCMAASAYVSRQKLVPPLALDALSRGADEIMKQIGAGGEYRNFAAVVLGNALWQDTFASVPYERRVLMLPQCLRDSEKCGAGFDEFGLLCESCGACPLGELLNEAESLGYVTVIAEGTTIVTGLLESGKVDAVLGASCLSALERAWPHMYREAIPGLAVPLLRDGCRDTALDIGGLRNLMYLSGPGAWLGKVDLDSVKLEVSGWFSETALSSFCDYPDNENESACEAIRFLSKGGKRWRPVLCASVYRSLCGGAEPFPEFLKKTAVAVECFHKASLIHDDIEDGDETRYGRPCLHLRLGVGQAINVGDYLLGLGYSFLAGCGAGADTVAHMLQVASRGHCAMGLGQGAELSWMQSPRALPVAEALEVFRGKTSSAFYVALACGALHAGEGPDTLGVLERFSDALGVAYQIRDDIADFAEDSRDCLRPGLLLALACEGDADEIFAVGCNAVQSLDAFRQIVHRRDLISQAQVYLEHYRNETLRSLSPLGSAHLKGLLQRLVARIFRG